MEIQLSQQSGSSQDQFNLCQTGGFSQNINIALHKLAETPSLRTVCSPYISHLQRLKRRGKLICIVRIVTGQRDRQIVTKSTVYQIRLFLRCFQFQLLPSL